MQKSEELQPRSTRILTDASQKKRETPWMDGNKFALTHGFYSQCWSNEEKAEREVWAQELIDEKGEPSHGERALIITASWLNSIITRTFKAIEEGRGAPAHEHLLAMINSFRLIMCALGLERRTKPVPNIQDFIREMEAKKEAERKAEAPQPAEDKA